jgi:hypothetical protein
MSFLGVTVFGKLWLQRVMCSPSCRWHDFEAYKTSRHIHLSSYSFSSLHFIEDFKMSASFQKLLEAQWMSFPSICSFLLKYTIS